MNKTDRKIKKSLQQAYTPPDECKIRQTVCVSENEFIRHESEKPLNYAEFLYRQSFFIKKRWWLIQGMVLLLLFFIMRNWESDFYVQRCMGIAAPIFGLLIIPEIWKNRSSGSMEIECASYFSLHRIYSARILLFAFADTILLSVFGIGAIIATNLTVNSFLIDFMLPLTVTCCICFFTLCSRIINSEYISLLLCMVWALIWLCIVLNEQIYNSVSVHIWLVILLISIFFLVYFIKRSYKNFEIFWEENPL